VSVTEPLTHGVPSAGAAVASPGTGRGARLYARFERLATHRNGARALGIAAFVGLAVFLIRPTFPNYDSYYDLVWGKALASGHLPDYNVLRTPTPHPLAQVYGAFLSLFGGAADRLFVLTTIACFLGLLVVVFRFTQHLLGTLIASVAVLVLLTRTDLEFYAMRAVVDVPFLLLVLSAALIELRHPRRGWPVLALLGLAGLLRPEAWVFAGVYFLWLIPGSSRRQLVKYALLTAAAPVIWVAFDLIVTSQPFYSLTKTREVAGEVARNRGLSGAITSIPDFIGGSEKVVNDVAGGLGALLALWLLRRRALVPLAMVVIGTVTFFMISAAGLSVIPRYMLIPSIWLTLSVGVALGGWTLVMDRRLRRGAIGLAFLSLALIAWRSPDYVNDARKLSDQANFVKEQQHTLQDLIANPRVQRYLHKPTCNPITMPTHSSIPVLRYKEPDIPKQRIRASIEQTRPPKHGVLLVARTFNFEPAAARSVVGAGGRGTQRKYWSNFALPTFKPVASNYRWRALADC
jgi:hypothetical protein